MDAVLSTVTPHQCTGHAANCSGELSWAEKKPFFKHGSGHRSNSNLDPVGQGSTWRRRAGNGQEAQAKITQSKLCWYSRSRSQVGTKQ